MTGPIIGSSFEDSAPSWDPRPAAPAGAPNIVLVVLDDVGFAQLGCFGSDIDTPVLNALADAGLRYRNFHTTALCSPTRSCLMTGRNHHRNHMGRITELSTGFPGYDARIPKENGFLSEILLEHNYATFALGKWHLTPDEDNHLAGSRTRWPLGRGFERFYGFMEGETHQFVPALVCDNHIIAPPATMAEGYHLTEDLIDRAIEYVGDVWAIDPDKPFFTYLALGACHAPHQAPPEWLERYRGQFDEGWDRWRDATLARQIELGVMAEGTQLSPRPDWVPAWDALEPEHQLLYARYMEAFAGFLSHADHHLGRFFDFLKRIEQFDNTIVIVLSDNGASSEGGEFGSVNDTRPWNFAPRTRTEALARIDEIGGPRCHNNYPWGWTVAGNTPFRRWKREVHEGGVADPFILSWPAVIADGGGVRSQYIHAVDVAPTLLECLGIESPDVVAGITQSHIDGLSFAASIRDGSAPESHLTQYYEMFGCRAIYHEGWKAVTYHPIMDTSVAFADDQWELYDVVADPAECDDQAARQPDRLAQMIERWWEQARANNVLPLDNRPFSDFVLDKPPPVPPRQRYEYLPHAAPVPEQVAVSVKNRNHRVLADIEIADGTTGSGVLISQGSLIGGWALYLLNGSLRYTHNYVGLTYHVIDGVKVAPGRHQVSFHFDKTAEHRGIGTLTIDGEPVGSGEIAPFTPSRFSLTGAGLSCGYSEGLPICDDFEAPFTFNGTIHSLVVEVDGEPYIDAEAEAEAAVARQ